MATIAAERLSTLLDRIYGCATNPGLWSATLVGINQVTACTQAVLGLVSFPENRTLMQAHTGIDEQFEGRLRDSMGQLEHIWAELRRSPSFRSMPRSSCRNIARAHSSAATPTMTFFAASPASMSRTRSICRLPT